MKHLAPLRILLSLLMIGSSLNCSQSNLPFTDRLQKALDDNRQEVRRAVVLALMDFESDKTTEALQQALKDSDFEVRMYAEEALKKIRTKGHN
ncbi:MAG: HEAT repeat domain-containing protein [bacterium]